MNLIVTLQDGWRSGPSAHGWSRPWVQPLFETKYWMRQNWIFCIWSKRHQCIALSLDRHYHLNMEAKMFQVIVTSLWPQSFSHGGHTLKVLLHSEQSNLGNQHVVKDLVIKGHLDHECPEASSYRYHHCHPKLTLTMILRHHHISRNSLPM